MFDFQSNVSQNYCQEKIYIHKSGDLYLPGVYWLTNTSTGYVECMISAVASAYSLMVEDQQLKLVHRTIRTKFTTGNLISTEDC